MRLRIRHANGITTLSDVSSEKTVLELKEDIIKAIAVSQDIQISGGFPPKPINDVSNTLSAVGIRDGDVLNVKLLDTPFENPARQDIPLGAPQTTNSAINDEAVEVSDGFLVVRTMEDDNSCLFRSIGKQHYGATLNYVLNRDSTLSGELRHVAAEEIKKDPYSYSDVTLGQPRDKYIEWIQKPNSWGGAIELAVFSSYFQVEIDSIDVQTGRIDKFGEGSYSERVLIVYSGIHYDAMALSPEINCPPSFDQTRFSVEDDSILVAAKKLLAVLRKKHKYTDIANFTLKCQQCNTGLVGEKEAQEHAGLTGHTHFVEYM